MNIERTRRFALPVAIGALLTLSAPAAAAPAERPIREDLSGSTVDVDYAPGFPDEGSDFDGRCSEPSDWVSTSTGTGVVSHLGRVTWTVQHCFQLATLTFTDGELTMIAANGDQLFGTYEGAMTSPTAVADTLTIDGGTGRFARASGHVDETGSIDPVSGDMEITGVGSIVYAASDRAPNR